MQKIIGYNLDSIRGGREHDKIFYIFIYKIFLLFEHQFSSEPNEFRSCSCLIPPESQMQPDNQRGCYPNLVVTFCRTSPHLKNLIETSGTYVWVSLLITVLITVLYVDTDHGGSSYREQYSLEILIGFYYIL